jgi:serine protease Do
MAVDAIEEPTKIATEDEETAPTVSEALGRLIERVQDGVVEVRGRGRGVGAGILWNGGGRVMTNYHVVEGTGGRPQILLRDGRRYETRTVAENPALDLAMLEVDATDLPGLPIGDSSSLRIGELVIAVGHPWGQKGVITMGIVSGLGQVHGIHTRRVSDYIRSDVRLAPGNSGGPLVNARGEVIGVNSMIFGGDLSVAVPSHVALDWLAHTGQAVYLGVGVRPVRLNAPLRSQGPTSGVLVVRLDPAGAAVKAGVRLGDVILAVADQPVADTASLRKALSQGVSNGKTEIAVVRDSTLHRISVTFEKAA